MEYEIIVYEGLCHCAVFWINNVTASYTDFGRLEDLDPSGAEEYGCGNMTFIPKLPTEKVLDKYSIDVDEYKKICEELDVLSFGRCGWCV